MSFKSNKSVIEMVTDFNSHVVLFFNYRPFSWFVKCLLELHYEAEHITKKHRVLTVYFLSKRQNNYSQNVFSVFRIILV